MNEESFNEEFCVTLEYHLCEVLSNSRDELLKGFSCDGVEVPHESFLTKKKINDSRKLTTTAWLGKAGQERYSVTIHFGKYSLRRYSKSKPLIDCLRDSTEQIKIDPFKKQLDLYLN